MIKITGVNKMMNNLKDILFHVFIPNYVFWKGKDIKVSDIIKIPKRYSGEIAFLIDLCFYGYLFMAITSWFYPYIYEHIWWYFMMLISFYTGSTFIPWFWSYLYSLGYIRKT